MSNSFKFRSSSKTAGSFTVAVASNFYGCMLNGLVPAYLNSLPSADRPAITVHHNSSGILYGEILDDPTLYQLFFSADDVRPAQLAEAAQPAAVQVITYAEGTLVAYSITLNETQIENVLYNFGWNSSAVANWHDAPYGQATKEFVQSVQGAAAGAQYDACNSAWNSNNGFNPAKFTADYVNIGETQTVGVYVDGKEIGFVSLGQVKMGTPPYEETEAWVEIPSNNAGASGRYQPIYQDACVILQIPGNLNSVNADAAAFYAWIQTSAAKAIIEAYGYKTNIPANASALLKDQKK
jgi:molybdate transport system substrate-binding protein